MSSEILFNSHALNSLKRAQLIKLCKRYGIKSTGKNHELVAKLEAYAQTLPPASTFICPSEADLLSSPSRGPYTNDSDSDEDEEQPHQGAGRPSDQWEPVSETDDVFAADVTIREASDEGSTDSRGVGGLGRAKSGRSIEEFGNKANGKVGSTGSKSSITSSLKSIASSFMRSNKPAPTPAPAPREPTPPPMPPRESTPPPVQGPGPHTVRLIASPVRPPRRSRSPADLLSGIPLPSPSPNKLAADLAQVDAVIENADGPESPTVARVSFGFGSAGYDQDEDISMTSGSGPTVTVSKPAESDESGDDVPGGFPTSPKPPVDIDSNSLAPPNAPFVFGSPRYSVSNTQFGDAAAAVLREMNARMGVVGASQAISIEQLQDVMANKTSAPAKPVERKVDVRFGDKHDKEFAKMDSIANHYSVASKKRKSQHESTASTSTTSAPKIFTLPPHITAPPSIPERSTKRARMSTIDGEEPSTSANPVSGNKVLQDSPAVRNNLEKKRRSSAARGSLGGAAARKSAGGARAAAPSTSRFGFMKMVRSVWGGGKKAAEKEKEKEKEKEAKPAPAPAMKPTDRKPSVGAVKNFPSVPMEEPVTVPTFPAVPKTKLVSTAGTGLGLGRPSGIAPKAGNARSSSGVKPSIGRASVDRKARNGTVRGSIPAAGSSAQSRTSTTSATTTAQLRTDSSSGIPAPSVRTRPASTLFAPTAASLARQGSVSVKAGTSGVGRPVGTIKPSAIPGPVKLVVTTRSVAGAARPAAGAGSRPLPVPPTGVGRAATSGAAMAGSPRLASPPVRASSVMSPTGRSVTSSGSVSGGVVSPTRKSMGAQAVSKAAGAQPAGRKSAVPQGMRSPSGGANKPRQSIFKAPLTVDAMTMRGAAPTIQPFRLSPQVNVPTTSAPPPAAASPTASVKKSTNTNTTVDTKANTNTTTTTNTSKIAPRPQRRPRISRSKVIAKLGEKRAAIAASNPISPNSKARSSAHERRSLGAVAAKRALDADMERRARARKSEAARRKSRVVAAGARRSEGAVLRRDRDGDVNMDN